MPEASNNNELFILKPGNLDLQTLRELTFSNRQIKLSPNCIEKISAASKYVEQLVINKQTVYGINTGFGLLANTSIADHELTLLQKSLVLSHAAGVGKPLDREAVRLILLLKINALGQGFSGIRLEVIEMLIALFNAEIYPVIPEKGSVGASGDLAPLAHLALVILGEGQVLSNQPTSFGVESRQTNAVLASHSISPIELAAKEGLALLNGTQVSTALALINLFRSKDLFLQQIIVGAMTVEASMASRVPFDDKIHRVRKQKGQIETARLFRQVLENNSEIADSHKHCKKVQDPYCLRCQPQVLGACLTQIRQAESVLVDEANGVTDNPLLFVEQQQVLSGGNFHAEPVAMAADNLALALAEMGSLSERRIAMLMDGHLSGLPPFLVEKGGVNSGFMIAQVTAAALASENKSLAHPASVDSIPTSANQEDHVSMATFAARRLGSMLDNSFNILAIEFLAATQGIDLRQPLKTTPQLECVKTHLRTKVPFYTQDRLFATDIEKAFNILNQSELLQIVKINFGS